jgi:hypothetical protein
MEPDLPRHDLIGTDDKGSNRPDGAQVVRVERRRWRAAALGVSMALVAGAVGAFAGHAASNHPARTAQAPGSPSGENPQATTGGLILPLGHFTFVFARTVAGITIRGYETGTSTPLGGRVCGPISGSRFRAEVSTAKMVGGVASSLSATSSHSGVTSVSASVLGVSEGDPTAVVVVSTSNDIARVQVQFVGGATDQMTPVRGWAVVAGRVPSADQTSTQLGVLTAYDSRGTQVARGPVPSGFGCSSSPGIRVSGHHGSGRTAAG